MEFTVDMQPNPCGHTVPEEWWACETCEAERMKAAVETPLRSKATINAVRVDGVWKWQVVSKSPAPPV